MALAVMFWLSRFSSSHTPQKVGELYRALLRDWSMSSVPLMRSVNSDPEFWNVNRRREYWPSTKNFGLTIPV